MIPQTLIIDLSEASFGGFSLVSATAERWTGKFNKATLIQLLFSAFRLLISTCGIRRFRNCGAVSHSRVLCVWGRTCLPNMNKPALSPDKTTCLIEKVFVDSGGNLYYWGMVFAPRTN